MVHYKRRFVLHQIYAYYAKKGELNWRDVASYAGVSTRTLRNYFGSVGELEVLLVYYHLSYLKNYYSNNKIVKNKDINYQLRVVSTVIKRHQLCYTFTNNSHELNLANRGNEIKQIHLNYILKAMTRGGVIKKKRKPEMVFNFFIAPMPKGEQGNDLIFHWMKWFMTP
jgi:hypothetical protein